MTVSLETINPSTDNWMDLFAKTNAAITALTEKAITVNSNTTTGEAKLNGTLEATTLTTLNIRGGVIGIPADIRIHDISHFSANTDFAGANTSFGVITNVHALGANTTHKMVMSNPATGKLRYADLREEITLIDGAGSGIDADMLDGNDSTFYTNIVARLGYTPINRAGDLGITGNLRTTANIQLTNTTISSNGLGLKIENSALMSYDHYHVQGIKKSQGGTSARLVLQQFPVGMLSCFELVLNVQAGSNYTVSKIIGGMGDGNVVNHTEYATINTGASKIGEVLFEVAGGILTISIDSVPANGLVTGMMHLVAK